ncbi:MAG: DUF4139 domain-containing protein [Bacteroidota bacterium]
MKAVNILLLSLIFGNLFSQEILEKEIKTDVNEVTVFLDGAQIVRKATVDLPKGRTLIRFVNLSPFIDAKSVQVKAEGDITVLSVNHQQNYLDKPEKSAELTDLEKQLENVDDKIKVEITHLSIINEELAFLQDNRDIGGKNEQVSVPNLQQASEFYSSRLTFLKMKETERNETINDLNEQRNDLENQIRTLTGKKEYPTGEIQVKVDAKQMNKFPLELTYLVGNAGWFPSYDIRAKNINEPVQLIYKANVKQDTKVDWKDVKLKFSSADPNVSGLAPELQPYYINYNTLPPIYNLTSKMQAPEALQGRAAGMDAGSPDINIRGTSSLAVPTAQVENQTSVNFEINTPYSVKSDNKNYTVDMEIYNLPAFYQYYSVPKMDKDAFLIANIVDWEKYNLLGGEANVFFEDTYVGKTLMDVRYAPDTLEISLGRDKQVSVNREKIKDFTDKQFIGSKKEETRAWKTTVKNNKNQAIHMIILDQVPVSTLEEIEVSTQEISGAKKNAETGEIRWEFELNPNNTKEFELKYSVKYPKSRNLIVE